jgi:DNA mismatch repair protein MutS2
MLQLSPKRSIPEAISFQNDLKCLLDLFNNINPPSINNDNKFYLFYKRISDLESQFLSIEPEEYITIKDHLQQMISLRQYLVAKQRNILRLEPIVSALQPDVELADTLERTFEPSGEIKDSASHELMSLRRKLKEVKKRIQSLLQETFNKPNADKYIQESVVVLRNGRYTIPCKTNFSQYISGIIHDRSASGQTLYVEPAACVAINNDMQGTILAENLEVARILAALLARFNAGLPTLHTTIAAYTELTFLIGLAAFYRGYDIVFPEFGEKIALIGLHHPLLKINKGDGSIPVDIKLSDSERLIVVSGPNTGGKTASLKSIGLNHLIAMSGLPVMARQANMVFFSDIKADIGDKQSLVMDLSTFSSHITNINSIITGIGRRALVMFDELGTGTDPREGAALALSVLDYLKDKNATVIVTTHFSELKAYAYEQRHAKLYSVDFNYDTYEPLYRLLEGIAGKSDPILIATRLGFPKEVIERADSYMQSMKSQSDMALEELNMMRAEAEHTKRMLAEQEARLLAKERKLQDGESDLQSKLSKKELQLLEETYALLQKGKRLADERAKRPAEEIAEDIKAVSEKITAIKSKQKPIAELKEGDVIFLERYGKIGKVLSLDAKTAYMDMEGLKVKIDRRELVGHKVGDNKPKPIKVSSKHTAESRGELVLVGKRVEEALDILDKYIDESHLSGYNKVYIVHGRGSGQLRRAIQDFLRTCGRINSYHTATTEEGGNAITVVEL